MDELQGLIKGAPNFLRYVAVAFALTIAFLTIYAWVTPWREMELIRKGNTAAALSFSGALVGFCMPLANTIAHSVSPLDVALWAGVALVVQILVHFATRIALPGLKQQIEAGQTSSGLFAGVLAFGFGLLNAACLTY